MARDFRYLRHAIAVSLWVGTVAFTSAQTPPAGPTESITLRDSRHGTDVWPPSATR